MLIITRNTKDNSIKVGNDIEIKVLRTESGQVRLGIEAPRDVSIIRSELVKRS